jgi:uncharacterized YkwD family protein
MYSIEKSAALKNKSAIKRPATGNTHNIMILQTYKYYSAIILAFFLIIFSGAAISHAANGANYVQAEFSPVHVRVDGDPVAMDAYNIAGYNYFKLRALASAVGYEVIYEEDADAVYVDAPGAYGGGGGAEGGRGTESGGEEALQGAEAGENRFGESTIADNASASNATISNATASHSVAVGAHIYETAMPAVRTSSSIIIDGVGLSIEAYNIGGYNYFKLRDFLSSVNIGVWYDIATDTIYIETDKSYDPDYGGPQAIIEQPVPLGAAALRGPDDAGDTSDAGGNIVIAEQQINAYRMKVVGLVNAEREAAGLETLMIDVALFKAAQFKSADMAENAYFDHISPIYGSPMELLNRFNIEYTLVGENIASGHPTPEHVMKGWLESPGHKANILNVNFRYIGVGLAFSDDGTPLWTQEFLRKPD